MLIQKWKVIFGDRRNFLLATTRFVSNFLSKVFIKRWTLFGHNPVQRGNHWSKPVMLNIRNSPIIQSLFLFFMSNENTFSWYVTLGLCALVLVILTYNHRAKSFVHLRQIFHFQGWVLLQFSILLVAMQARFYYRLLLDLTENKTMLVHSLNLCISFGFVPSTIWPKFSEFLICSRLTSWAFRQLK